jgi:hypothetical protein
VSELFADEIYPSFNLPPGEEPLSDGGRWGPYSVRPQLRASDSGLHIHGTEVFVVNGSYYKQKAYHGPVVSAYGCMLGSGLGAALESNRIVALIGDVDEYNGYSSGFGGGIGQTYFFRRYDNFEFTGIGGGPWTNQAPAKLGIRITPDRVEQWAYFGGPSGEQWYLIQFANDTTYRGPVHFALETEEAGSITEVGWSCFGAGTENDPEFLLWMPSAAPQ